MKRKKKKRFNQWSKNEKLLSTYKEIRTLSEQTEKMIMLSTMKALGPIHAVVVAMEYIVNARLRKTKGEYI